MKIAHVVRRLSFDDWGGTEQVVWNIAKAQRASGDEVRVFATTALCPVRLETREGIGIFRFPPVYPWWPMPQRLVAELDRKGGNPFVPGLARALEDWKPDVIHCHAMARIAELCLRTAEKIRAKSAISLHGGSANVPEAEAQSLRSPTRRRVPWGKFIDVVLRRTRDVPGGFGGIVCVGEDEYEKFSAQGKRAVYLPNGVDCRLFSSAASSASSFPVCSVPQSQSFDGQREPPVPSFSICSIARIDRQKNQMFLVEALSRHPGARLRLAGPVTQPDYRDELAARARELGVEGRLEFAGALAPGSAELVAEYARADVFALASRHEPFGIAVLEAWAAGTPVVAARVGGLARLCAAHPKAAETFEPGDGKSFDAALSRALDPSRREEMRREGLAAARLYDWSALARRLSEFYAAIPR